MTFSDWQFEIACAHRCNKPIFISVSPHWLAAPVKMNAIHNRVTILPKQQDGIYSRETPPAAKDSHLIPDNFNQGKRSQGEPIAQQLLRRGTPRVLSASLKSQQHGSITAQKTPTRFRVSPLTPLRGKAGPWLAVTGRTC